MSTSRPGVVAILGLRTFVGRELALRLATRSPAIRVVGLDLRRPFGLDERVRFHRVDLTDPRAGAGVAAILERERVEAVLHAAFRTDPTPDLEADHELDTIGSLHVMNACAAAKVRRLVVASSTMLYGPYSDNPNYLGEDHPLRGHPAAHSVRDRIEMERLLVDWRERHPDVEVSVLRACWAIGPTFSNRIVPARTRNGCAPGLSVISGLRAKSENMISMSMIACLISRYTMPMKFNGVYSWIIIALIITKSPTVLVPARMPRTQSTMAAARPSVNNTACPALSTAREV